VTRAADALLAFALAGCAADALVLTPTAATDAAGVVSFPTAGGVRRVDAGRFSVEAVPATITGDLRFPPGSGPFPAIVLAHGCNGNRNTENAWGPVLRSWGYATFVLDSFGGRGIDEVCTKPVLAPLQRVPDAYGALRLLAAHSRIDAKRVALMGFSHGGSLTMLASTAWAKETFAGGGAASFRAFFPFYPNCNAEFPERRPVSAPLRIHTGEADDWTPAGPCADLARSLKAAGQDASIDLYPGAHHAFDQARSHFRLPNVNNGSNCFPQMASILGPFVAGSAPFSCVTKGATVAGNAEALSRARQKLRAQLDELMK